MDINCSNGVYELISELCRKTASSYTTHSRTSQTVLASKMRSISYEIILKKSTLSIPNSNNEPTVDLLSFCFVSQQNASNVAEYKRSVELKSLINVIHETDFGDYKDHFQNVLRLLLCLQNTKKPDLETAMFQVMVNFLYLHKYYKHTNLFIDITIHGLYLEYKLYFRALFHLEPLMICCLSRQDKPLDHRSLIHIILHLFLNCHLL